MVWVSQAGAAHCGCPNLRPGWQHDSAPQPHQLVPSNLTIERAQPVKARYHSLPNHSTTSDHAGTPGPVTERSMF